MQGKCEYIAKYQQNKTCRIAFNCFEPTVTAVIHNNNDDMIIFCLLNVVST